MTTARVALILVCCLAGLLSFGPALGKDKPDKPGENGNAYGQDKGGDHPGNDNDGNNGNNGKNDGDAAPDDTAEPGPPVVLDQDLALDAVRDGRALPLEDIVAKVRATSSGEMVDARLLTVGGFLLYEVKILEGSRVESHYFYARTGAPVGD